MNEAAELTTEERARVRLAGQTAHSLTGCLWLAALVLVALAVLGILTVVHGGH